MSKVGADKARERKQKQQERQAGTQPAAQLAPQFVFCVHCTFPNEAGCAKCDRCGRRGPWVPMQNTEGMTLEQLQRVDGSIAETAGRTAMAAKRWVASLHLYTERLSDPADTVPDEEVNMFYIRLHGVIAEIPEQLAGNVFAGASEAEARKMADPKAPQYLAAHRSATEAVKLISEGLTRDQHVYAEWRRHTECHLRQSAFTVQVQGKLGEPRKLKGQSTIKGLASEGPIQVEDLNATIRRTLAAHGGDDDTVARAIANQIRAAVEQLASAWARFP